MAARVPLPREERPIELRVAVKDAHDVLLSLRSLVAFAAESRRLRAAADGTRYVVGFQRFETTGTGLAATEVLWENARPHWWAPVDIGGDLYLLPTNVHAGAYALTRADFEAVAAECPAYVVEKRKKQGRKRVIQRLFNVGVLEAMSERKASTL